MPVTDLHNRPDPAYRQRLVDQRETVADLIGAQAAADEKLDEIDRCLNDLLRRSTGALHDLNHADYEDAAEDVEAMRRAMRNLRRITAPLQARVDGLLAVQHADAAGSGDPSC
ncbi:hypothetical protein AB0F88_16780 [Streptosporangium sp. NPDC023963]|uniref:hypothetical protein n=1 Tax=Streptosporangium sp. NPDC023963 TaxID=3155608 RepID=UPI0034370485